MTFTLEEAKKEINVTLTKLKNGDKETLKQAVDDAFTTNSSTASTPQNLKSRFILFPFLLVLLPVISLIIASQTELFSDSNQLEFRYLLSFIAFVVALASYLAATVRDIVRSLRESGKDSLRWNIFGVSIAESSLLFFGLIVLFRIYKGGFIISWTNIYSDSFIISYLSVILTYLVLLHFLAWIYTKPWTTPKMRSG